MADARLVIGADATAVERACAIGTTALKQFADQAKSAVGYALSSVASSLSEVALASGKINFAGQHQQVREFEQATARFAVAAGQDLEKVRSQAEATGVAIGKRPGEVTAWASEVGKLTYNFGGAMAGMKGMAELAASTGRNVEDYRGLATELQTIGHVSGDTSKMVGLLKQQADNLGTSGGVAAFADQIQNLSETFSHFSAKSPQDFANLTQLAGTLGKGLSPIQAGRVQQNVLGSLAGNSMEWSRYLGRDILDEQGEVKDPSKTVGDIVSKIERTYKGDAKRMLRLQFGAEAGSQLDTLFKSGDLFKSPGSAGGATTASPADALGKLLGTDAGKRNVADAELSKASRDLMGSSSLLGRAADALQKFAASNPIAATAGTTAASTLISGMLGGKVAGKIIGAGGDITGGIMKAGGAAGVGALGTGSLLLGAGLVGAGAGAALGYGLNKLDDKYDFSGSQARVDAASVETFRLKEIRDRVRAAKGLGGNISAADTALAQHAGSAQGMQAFVAALKSEGKSDADAEKIGRAVADALMKAMPNMAINVTSTPDNPLSATVRTSQSSAAGNQSGT